MNERFSVILTLSLSFTEQVKAIYCFNALVCVIITRPRSYEASFAPPPLLSTSNSCPPFTFPVISSPVFRICSDLQLILDPSQKARWVEGDQLGVTSTAAPCSCSVLLGLVSDCLVLSEVRSFLFRSQERVRHL